MFSSPDELRFLNSLKPPMNWLLMKIWGTVFFPPVLLSISSLLSGYLDNSISSENLDLLFTKKISKIYNNVVYKNNYLNLNTDKIIIDMTTGDLKLEMNNKQEKVRLITKYEFN